MSRIIRNQRDIVDRRELIAELGAIDSQLGATEVRAKALAIVKVALQRGSAEVRRRFEAGTSGTDTIHAQSFLMDQLIRVLYDFTVARVYPIANPTTSEHICIVAVGGYGRGELAPQSDIDLLFALPYKQTPHGEQVVEFLLYLLWDLGLKVGHSTRSLDECIRQARADMTVRTSLLEARHLWAEMDLFTDLRRKFAAEVLHGTGTTYVELKLAERDTRHARMGDSRYLLEPNIKEGKGGLRDLQTLFWMGKYLYQVDSAADLVDRGVLSAEAAAKFAKCENFLWTVRCWLHYLTGRPEDRLTFDMQAEIGARMGYRDRDNVHGVERFMKHYFLVAKDVGDLTRIFCASLEAKHQRKPRFRLLQLPMLRRSVSGFRLESARLTVTADDSFEKDPLQIIRLFHVAQEHALDIHPHTLKLITQNLKLLPRLRHDAEANRLFMEILTSRKDPETALKQMNEAGVFGRFIPDFGRIVAQMQHDMYHVYTVDEHSIRAIGILATIERGEMAAELPIATEVMGMVASRRALYLAVLIHDIGKGRGGDHSKIGAKIAANLGPRLGLSVEETETTAWLVQNHLLMTHFAFKRDVNDPQTIRDYAEVIQSPERLRLLLVLTIADVRAVGPTVWNDWKAALLRELFFRTDERLSGTVDVRYQQGRVEVAKEAAARGLAGGWPEEDVQKLLSLAYPAYWLAFDTATHVRHALLVKESGWDTTPLTVRHRVDSVRGATEITVYTADFAGLFSQIAGAMAVSGANIVEAKIFTMTNGMALDTFWIQDAAGEAFERPERLARLVSQIEKALTGRMRPRQELAAKSTASSRTKAFQVPIRVLIDNRASTTFTVIEVNGRDRPGLLYDLTRVLTGLNVQISSALIGTFGARVVDVFYVKDLFGFKIDHPDKVRQIRDQLTAAISDSEGESPPPRRRRVPRKPAEEEEKTNP